MRVDWSPRDPVGAVCETLVVSAANGTANPTMSSVVTLGVDVVKVTCLGRRVVLSQLIVVFGDSTPSVSFDCAGQEIKDILF